MDTSYPLKDMRVLIVEDDYLVAQALRDAIEEAGARAVGPVASAADAINLAMREKLDGVLLDVKLQGTNGATVAEALRSKHVPFVLVTGYDEEALDSRLQRAHRLTKPVLFADLVEKAAAVFGR